MELKEILTVSKNHISELLFLDGGHYRVEQADFNKKTKNWEIVISFLTEKLRNPSNSGSTNPKQPEFEKIYKIIKISESGEVLGFYIFYG